METESIHVSAIIPARREALYDAWLSSELHGKMTGSAAAIEPHVGGCHRAWGDYISGKTLELEPGRRIVQSWRTLEFPSDSADSQIAVSFEEDDGHTRVSIALTGIPAGQGAQYESGWHEHYFDPMVVFFATLASHPRTKSPAAKKPAPKKRAAKTVAPKKATAKKAAAKKAVKRVPPRATKKAAAKRTGKKRTS